MGRGIRHSKNKKPSHRERPQKQGQGAGYKEIVRDNPLFDAFYRANVEVCPKAEYEEMMNYLRRDLPASFRVTGFRSQVIEMNIFLHKTENYLFRENLHTGVSNWHFAGRQHNLNMGLVRPLRPYFFNITLP